MGNYDDYTPHIYYNDDEEQSGIPEINNHEILSEVRKKKNKVSAQKSKKPVAEKNEGEKKKTAKKDNTTASSLTFIERIKIFFVSRNTAIVTGIILAGVAAYFLISFVSYLGTCFADQSVIQNNEFGSVPPVRNSGGEGGARLSEFLINGGFGLGAFVVIIWLICISLKLLVGIPKIRSLDFTLKCLIGFITLSLIVGLFTIGSNTTINWGGYHGRYVNEWIIGFFGWIGAVILCLVMVALFVFICMRDVVKWVMVKKRILDAKRKEMMAKRAEEREKARILAEQQRLEQELDTREKELDQDVADAEPEGLVFDTDILYPESREEVEESTWNQSPDHNDSSSEYKLKDEDEDEENKSEIPAKDDTTDAGIDVGNGQPSSTTLVEASENIEEGEAMEVHVNQIGKADSPDYHPAQKGSLYKFPSVDLLVERDNKITVSESEMLANEEKIRQTLLDYDIPIVSIKAHVGPTVTLYEIRPDKSFRISKIKNLVGEIALNLSANGVRIIAPIPGKGTIGIEVANEKPQTVSMRSIIESPAYQESKAALPIALGSTIQNDVYIADLASQPHLLVAGATGQGKSVGLNVIIMSLIYKRQPDELKFVMFDPKMVEFNLYAAIEKQYLAKLPDEEEAIVTDMNKVVPTLKALCTEMDNRYTLLKEAEVRKLEEYNKMIKSGKLKDKPNHRFLPYIVVVIDEFADLIMVAGKDVEIPIARLAQKARAVGIHVIIATQRPSRQVITGLIKSNFPGRIAFKVAQSMDSRIILDANGAEQLIGRGDLLMLHNSEMVRVQCAFVDTPEVKAICEHIASQPAPIDSPYILPEPEIEGGGVPEPGGSGKYTGERDPLYDEIKEYVIMSGTASTSNIQRRYEIGYNRAGRIMDQLEADGIVGPSHGGKPRTVLVN